MIGILFQTVRGTFGLLRNWLYMHICFFISDIKMSKCLTCNLVACSSDLVACDD